MGYCPLIGTKSSRASVLPVQNNESVNTLSDIIAAYLSLALFHVNLIPKDNKGEVLRVVRTCLNEKFISPAIQSLKRL